MNKQILVDLNLLKKNYQGNYIPVTGGIILIISTIISWYILFLLNLVNAQLLNIYIFIISIIGITGLLDDICGNKNSQGFRDHFKSLINGKLTTGILKVIITILVSMLVLFELEIYILSEIIINAGIIILMTNLLNLLDLRPARSIKAFFCMAILLIIFNLYYAVYFLPFFFTLIFYLPFELKSKLMLGDSGANLLGTVLGFNTILMIEDFYIKLIILLFLVILNVVSEKYSYSTIIQNNPLLSWIDQLGR